MADMLATIFVLTIFVAEWAHSIQIGCMQLGGMASTMLYHLGIKIHCEGQVCSYPPP